MTVDIPKLRELIAVMNETGSQDTHEEARDMLVKAMPEVLDELETRRDETKSGVEFWRARTECAEAWVQQFLRELRECKAKLAEIEKAKGGG